MPAGHSGRALRKPEGPEPTGKGYCNEHGIILLAEPREEQEQIEVAD